MRLMARSTIFLARARSCDPLKAMFLRVCLNWVSRSLRSGSLSSEEEELGSRARFGSVGVVFGRRCSGIEGGMGLGVLLEELAMHGSKSGRSRR